MDGVLNSESICGLIHLPISHEPSSENIEKALRSVVFIGNSHRLSVPVILNMENCLNPHILICGMTGGGKTFLARSLVTRLHLFADANIVVIDFTGEYASFLRGIAQNEWNGPSGVFGDAEGIFYADLHGLGERAKVYRASELLEQIATLMRSREFGYKRRIFILLDEAWKLVEDSHGLEAIIREGRKYGVGLITSSQMLHDTGPSILSNIATLFVFKTTTKASLERLSKSYSLSEDELHRIQDLEMGSCFLIQLHKSGARSAFQVKRISGIKEADPIIIRSVVKMEIRVEREEFEYMVRSLCGSRCLEITKLMGRDNSIELTCLISKLIEVGTNRVHILREIKKFGFSDSDIADAFSASMCKRGEKDAD